MTNEQINRAVADELIGTLCWTEQSEESYGHRSDCPCNGTGLIELDFCTDHNAAAEMRKGIRAEEREAFGQRVFHAIYPGPEDYLDLINATPRQQAEAFLRMRGRWRE